MEEVETGDIAEIGGVERPEWRAANDGAGGHGQIEFALPRSRHGSIEIRCPRSLTWAERQRLFPGEQRLLVFDL